MAEKSLEAISESLVSDGNQCSRPSRELLLPEVTDAISVWTSYTPKTDYMHIKHILVVQDDWNAKVGPDAYLHWAGTVGRFGIGETNGR